MSRLVTFLRHKLTLLLIKIIIVAVGIFIFYSNRDTTTVTVRPHYQYVELSDTITAYKNPKQGNLGFDIIAITDESSLFVIANEERPVNIKASGEITIYNNFSREPQRLIPKTRFAAAGGKIFFLGDEEVIIPGKVGDEPGSATAIVYAQNAGEQYNIDITDFSIPGFKEAGLIDKYNGMYAVSNQNFSGGIIGTEKYISENKRTKSESELNKDLTERLLQNLENEKTDNVLVVEGSAEFRFKDSEYISDEIGSAGVLSQRGTILALVVGKEELGEYIANNYFDLAEDEKITPLANGNLKLALTGSDFDFDNATSAQISLSGNPLYTWIIDEEELKKRLREVPTVDLPERLDNTSSVDRAIIKIRPFWRKITSDHVDNIKIKPQ